MGNDSAAVSKMDSIVIAEHAPKNIPEAMTVLPCQEAVGTHAFSAHLEEACFLVRLDSWGDLATHARKGAIDAFNSYGFCVMECHRPWDDTLDIHALFGNFVEHPLADSMGGVYIDPSLEPCLTVGRALPGMEHTLETAS